MYRENKQHEQGYVFSNVTELPKKQRERLETSWAATFYRDFFSRIDESKFEVLYSDKASRPNVPVNVLVSLEALKAGFGWSDAELEEQLAFNLQTRYALGYRDLTVGHFELRTVNNFRQRLAQYMQETGENLLEGTFEQVTDEQITVLKLKTGKLRMDSVQIASNIRQMSRIQLLVEVLPRVWRMLSADEQRRKSAALRPYTSGTSSQYTYQIEPGEGQSHLEAIGAVMQSLVAELATVYAENVTDVMLKRVYAEHFIEVEAETIRPKVGSELSAQSLQSPDDWEATYRQKRGVGDHGYVTNVTETGDPENPLQLIVKVQTAPNATDDGALLNAAVPNLVARTAVDELHTDGGYNSPVVDTTLTANHIEQFQTAIRGAQPATDHLSVSDFVFSRDDQRRPLTVTCPQGQSVTVVPARNDQRFTALFDASLSDHCPLLAQCPTQAMSKKPKRVLRFDQRAVNVAHRRAKQRQAKASGHNLRSAVEATIRSIKHPFANAKLSVRGRIRVSMTMGASAAMTNIRRICRYQQAKMAKLTLENELMAVENSDKRSDSHPLCAFLPPFFCWVATSSQYQAPAA
ncbi:MAG: transposase [Aggregatilineales bacterium]